MSLLLLCVVVAVVVLPIFRFSLRCVDLNCSGSLAKLLMPVLTWSVLYSGTMKRMVRIALVACVILFILAIFISPMVDIQPSALRAQQWLSFIVAMISLDVQIIVCLLTVPLTISPPICEMPVQHRVCVAELSCCLLC